VGFVRETEGEILNIERRTERGVFLVLNMKAKNNSTKQFFAGKNALSNVELELDMNNVAKGS
jgi:hypothetical protein